jgi:serine/threonine protein kinase
MSIDNNEPNYWKQLETNYKIGELLGKGSFGTVHKALHLATDHEVAIKLI